MKTKQFLKILDRNKGKQLHFKLPDGTVLMGDLHITEVMNSSVRSVDCGGRPDHFNETVTQLWMNERSGKAENWTVDKMLSIYDKVMQHQDLDPEGESFIEYGDSEYPTIRYSIRTMHESGSDLTVQLGIKPTACKPKAQGLAMSGCC